VVDCVQQFVTLISLKEILSLTKHYDMKTVEEEIKNETTKKSCIDHSFYNSRIIFHYTPVISGTLPDTVWNL